MSRPLSLDDILRPGNTVALHYKDVQGLPNPSNKTIHIRALVDEDWIVYRWYAKGRKRWFYEVQYRYFFQLLFGAHELRLVKGTQHVSAQS